MTVEDQNIGRQIAGRYRLDALLGRGGFGSVYRGWDAQIGRDVAVKLLDVTDGARSARQTAELRERFRREAMAAGRINHNGVVTIYDFGIPEDDGEAYLVMEFLDGHDLSVELRDNGPMLPDRAQRLFIPVLEALGAGHELGIVHKDIKPQNIFLCHPGTNSESLCLVDFGIARVVHEDKLTLTGLIVGTPQYMAPEYITDTLVTPALDVYQMGLILVELITGSPAVPAGERFVESCNRHFTGDLKIPDELHEGEFGQMLRMALRPIPKERIQTAKRFAEMFAEIDPSTIVLETRTTMEFARQPSDTVAESQMYPPMQPAQVSQELQRLEAGSDAHAEPPHTPVSVLQPKVVVDEQVSVRERASVAAGNGEAEDDGRAPEPAPDIAPAVAPATTPGAVVATPPIAASLTESEPPPVDTAPGVVAPRRMPVYAITLAIFVVGFVAGLIVLATAEPGQTAISTDIPREAVEPAAAVGDIEIEKPVMTTIMSEPSGARIVLDGKEIGRTPKAVDVSRADVVELHLEGYDTALVALEPDVETIKLTRTETEAPDSRPSDSVGASKKASVRRLVPGEPFDPEEPDAVRAPKGARPTKPQKFESTRKNDAKPEPWKSTPVQIAD